MIMGNVRFALNFEVSEGIWTCSIKLLLYAAAEGKKTNLISFASAPMFVWYPRRNRLTLTPSGIVFALTPSHCMCKTVTDFGLPPHRFPFSPSASDVCLVFSVANVAVMVGNLFL